MLKILTSFVCLLLFSTGLFAKDIAGFWQIVNEKTNVPECIVAVYQYQDKYYGRIIATYNNKGEVDETIYSPKSRAPGVVGDPYYCGLDFIYDLEKRNARYKGKIMDPKKGRVYNAELWRNDGDLIVRGELFVFGRNQTWYEATAADFPKNFKMPDTSEFVPVVHDTK